MISLFQYIYESVQEDLIKKFKSKFSSFYQKVSHTITPKHDILIISQCGDTKDTSAKSEKVPAHDLYLGPANKILNEELPQLDVDWVIMSGAYGLISNDEYINYYDDVHIEITPTTYKEMQDFTKYSEDLCKIVKKGNYKKIIFTVGIRFIYSIDFNELKQAAGDECEIIVFLPKQIRHDDDFEIPDSITCINIARGMLKTFHCAELFAKERITVEYLKYIKDHKDINIEQFIKK